MSSPALHLAPISLREANAHVVQYHGHHGPTPGYKFAIGCYAGDRPGRPRREPLADLLGLPPKAPECAKHRWEKTSRE